MTPFVVFVVLSILDALFTSIGILRHGVAIEANPVVAYFIMHLGAMPALALTKCIAIGLAAYLMKRKQDGMLWGMSLFMVYAVGLWVVILWGMK